MPYHSNTSEMTTPARQRRERNITMWLITNAVLGLILISSVPISTACGFGFAVGLFSASGDKNYIRSSDFIATSIVSAIVIWFSLIGVETMLAIKCLTKTRSSLRFFPRTIHLAASPFVEIYDLKNRLANVRNKNNEETERLLTRESTDQEHPDNLFQELRNPTAPPERITHF